MQLSKNSELIRKNKSLSSLAGDAEKLHNERRLRLQGGKTEIETQKVCWEGRGCTPAWHTLPVTGI